MLILEDQATLDLVGQQHNVAVLGFPIYESMINFSRAIIDQSGEILFNLSRQRNDTIPTSGKEKCLESCRCPSNSLIPVMLRARDRGGTKYANCTSQRNTPINIQQGGTINEKDSCHPCLLRPDCASGIHADAQETNNNYRTTDHGDGTGR